MTYTYTQALAELRAWKFEAVRTAHELRCQREVAEALLLVLEERREARADATTYRMLSRFYGLGFGLMSVLYFLTIFWLMEAGRG
jgi:myo-inositol catabolism protein IolC